MHTFNKNINYKIIFFTLFSFCCSFKVFCASPDLKQAILDGINEDRNIRAKAPLKSDDIAAIKPLSDTGLYASAIYEVQFKNKKPFICKLFKDKDQGEDEAECFELWRDEFEISSDWKNAWGIPHFVKYKGAGEYVDQNKQVKKLVLLEKANGKSLFRLIEDEVLEKDSYWLWNLIGRKLAEYHLSFGEVLGDTYVSHVHGDLHVSNIFVNVFDLSFIDYASLTYSKEDISIDLEQIFGHSYEYFTDTFMKTVKKTVYNIAGSFEEAYKLLNKVAKNLQSVFEKIRQGYVDTFSAKGLNINIDDKGKATLTHHPVIKKNFELAPVSQIATLGSFLQAAKKRADAAKVHLSQIIAKPVPKSVLPVAKPVPAVVKPIPAVVKPIPAVVKQILPVVIKPAPKAKAKPAPKAKAKPAPKAKAKPAPKAKAKPAPKAKAKPAPKVKAKPAPKVKAKPAPKVKTKPAPKVKTKPAPKVKTKPAPKAKAKPAPKAKAKPAPKAKVKPAPKAKAKPAPKVKAKPAPKAKAKTKALKKNK